MKTKADKIKELSEKKKTSKILKFIDDEDTEVRAAAMEALGECGDAEAVETLQYSIRDASPEVRMAVAKAFQKVGNNRVFETLHHQMLQETDAQLKAEFEKAMSFTRDRKPE